jgi:GT2 family glycosyltransferase
MAQNPDVLVTYLHGATNVDSAFLDSMTMLLVRDRGKKILDVASFESGPYITDGRNMQAEVFLGTRAKWALFLDCDMAFDPDIVTRLLRYATPDRMVGALCFSYNGRTRDAKPVLFGEDDARRIEAWEPGSLVPVGAIGMACVLVHRNIFEKMPRPWFQNVQLPNGAHMDQDQAMCLNARLAGFKIAVDTSTEALHGKRILVGSRDYSNRWTTSKPSQGTIEGQ